MEILEEGTKVKHVTGGPEMAIHMYRQDMELMGLEQYFCKWFDNDNLIQKDVFSRGELIVVED